MKYLWKIEIKKTVNVMGDLERSKIKMKIKLM